MYKIDLVNLDHTYTTIYDQRYMNTYSVIGPKYEFELNEAGSLTFTLVKGHPLYNTLEPLASYVRLLDEGEEIFYGRIIQRSEPTLTGQVSFICEGALSFLMDSEIAPFGKDNKGNPITRTMTAEEFLRLCITQHNAEVDDPRRHFIIGNVTANKRNNTDEYSITNYTQTKSAIESNILDVYGGIIATRRNSNGGLLIDWIENYETVNPQPITIGTNVEEQTNEMDGSSLFTVIRPLGNDGLTLPEETVDVYSSADIEKYGRIVKTIDFKNAENVDQLRAEAQTYVQGAHKTLFSTSTIQLVDMHYLDGNYPKVRGGDRFTNIQGYEGTELIAGSLELDLENLQNDSVTLKNRKSMEPDGTTGGGRGRMKSSGGRGGGGGGGGGAFLKYILEAEDYLEVIANEVYMHGQTLTQHYEQILQNADYYESISSRVTSAEDYIDEHTEKFNDVEYNIREIQGTGVIQNSQFISALSGHFEIWTDSITGKPIVHLKNGAEISVDDATGGTITVGERLEQYGADIAGNKAVVDSLQGSALWTQRDQIVGVAGEYDIQYIEVEDPPGSGTYVTKKVLVVKSGGGLKIQRDNVEYGLYDEGTLTAGLMVEKINNETHAVISADHLDLSVVNGRIDATAAELLLTLRNEMDDMYTQIIADAEHIVIRTGDNTKTFKGETAPTGTQQDPLLDGDVWFEGEGTFTWGDVSGTTWLEDAGHVWGDAIAGSVHRYNGTTNLWEKVIDQKAVLQDTRFEQSKEEMKLMAGRVDVVDEKYHAYYSELKVEADNIHAQVHDYYNDLHSNIVQTAGQIRSEVHTANSQIYSHITQTASYIRAEVGDARNDLGSAIEQTASHIYSAVYAAKSQLYSSIEQTASHIRSEVVDARNDLQSSITQTASQIRLEVSRSNSQVWSNITQNADSISLKVSKNGVISAINQTPESITIQARRVNLEGYVTADMMSSTFQDINQITCQQLSVHGYFTCLSYNATWQETTIPTLSFSGNVYVHYGNDYSMSGYIVRGHGSKTIHYLGR